VSVCKKVFHLLTHANNTNCLSPLSMQTRGARDKTLYLNGARRGKHKNRNCTGTLIHLYLGVFIELMSDAIAARCVSRAHRLGKEQISRNCNTFSLKSATTERQGFSPTSLCTFYKPIQRRQDVVYFCILIIQAFCQKLIAKISS